MINKRGQGSLGIAIMVSLMLLVVGLMAINFITPEITSARASVELDCANAAGISDGNKLLCLAIDLIVPYWIIIILSMAGGYIVSRFIIK